MMDEEDEDEDEEVEEDKDEEDKDKDKDKEEEVEVWVIRWGDEGGGSRMSAKFLGEEQAGAGDHDQDSGGQGKEDIRVR